MVLFLFLFLFIFFFCLFTEDVIAELNESKKPFVVKSIDVSGKNALMAQVNNFDLDIEI